MVLEIEKSNEILKDVPGMIFDQALFMDDFLKKHNLTNLLELGFAHGTSSCYMASTLREMGEGHLTTIDLKSAKFRQPNIETLLDKLDLNDLVTPYYENTSYTWRLMKFIEDNNEPIYDFCYVDGAHDWYNDGFAFFFG
ncbi:class I SAM-dependent methyltransferase [uncultured Methanobrevibacter sp.]|uniref:class I SAM-dependent methyltransferase n=1 Tax=uncultured Methanobrevibacter sp. TaxID=253161 RepID=UPI00320BA321